MMTGYYYDYQAMHGKAPPQSMSMDRLGEMDELVLAQTTQLCCREGCCRSSINWVLLDASNYELPGYGSGTSMMNPFELPSVGGWIHEESAFFQRCCCPGPGCRETKFVHHAGLPPRSLKYEDKHCCHIQTGTTSSFLTQEELSSDIVAIHEKEMTCSAGVCWCCNLPYLRTLDNDGRFLGETKYVCDGCIFVPKFIVIDQNHNIKYLLRPDTCCMGLCPRPRFGGTGGKCCRLPFLVRDPITKEPISSNAHEGKAQVTELWSGVVNELLFKRHAYHIAFPSSSSDRNNNDGCTVEDKLTLIGSSILVDVAVFEHQNESQE